MDRLDNNNIGDEVKARETGNSDKFDVNLIPLQSSSYLGECLVISKPTAVLIQRIWMEVRY